MSRNIAVVHSRPSTPLGLLGRAAFELRSQIYDETFAPIYDAAIMIRHWLPTETQGLRILFLSKAIRAESIQFLLKYRRFRYTINVHRANCGRSVNIRPLIVFTPFENIMNLDLHFQMDEDVQYCNVRRIGFLDTLKMLTHSTDASRPRGRCVILVECATRSSLGVHRKYFFNDETWKALSGLHNFKELSVRFARLKGEPLSDLVMQNTSIKAYLRGVLLKTKKGLESSFGPSSGNVDAVDQLNGVLISWCITVHPFRHIQKSKRGNSSTSRIGWLTFKRMRPSSRFIVAIPLAATDVQVINAILPTGQRSRRKRAMDLTNLQHLCALDETSRIYRSCSAAEMEV